MEFTYLNLLALNNITQVLTFDERVMIRQKLFGKLQDVKSPDRIIQLLSIIKSNQWERPPIEYRETENGKVLFYYDTNTESFKNINTYQHPILEEVKPFNITENV